MDTVEKLPGQLLRFWLAITGIAVAFGVLHAVGSWLRRKQQHPGRAESPSRGS